MTKKALKVLKLSIEHWDRLATGKAEGAEKPSNAYCALCRAFCNTYSDWGCDGCPVKMRTGRAACVRTPYPVAAEAWHFDGADSPRFIRAANRELEFLRSLLPKEVPEK